MPFCSISRRIRCDVTGQEKICTADRPHFRLQRGRRRQGPWIRAEHGTGSCRSQRRSYRTNPMSMPPQLRSVVPSGLQLYAVKKKPTYLSLYIYRCTCSTYRISMIKGTDAIQQNKQFMHKWMWVYICLWLSEIIRESIKEASNGRTSQLCHIWRVINFRMYVCLSVCWSGYTLWWK